uniref:Uncharacterized protein n=1 Tax=Micrurus spixii TaxID=129469 RepID=A0A2D4L744_9SAUR
MLPMEYPAWGFAAPEVPGAGQLQQRGTPAVAEEEARRAGGERALLTGAGERSSIVEVEAEEGVQQRLDRAEQKDLRELGYIITLRHARRSSGNEIKSNDKAPHRERF